MMKKTKTLLKLALLPLMASHCYAQVATPNLTPTLIGSQNFEGDSIKENNAQNIELVRTYTNGEFVMRLYGDGTSATDGVAALPITGASVVGATAPQRPNDARYQLVPAMRNLIDPSTGLDIPSSTRAGGFADVAKSGGTGTVIRMWFKTAGFRDIRLSFDYRWATPRGFDVRYGVVANSDSLTVPVDQYQIWSDDATSKNALAPSGAWGTYILDLASASQIENLGASQWAWVEFKDFEGGDTANGQFLIDNLVVSGVSTAAKVNTGISNVSTGTSISSSTALIASDERNASPTDKRNAVYSLSTDLAGATALQPVGLSTNPAEGVIIKTPNGTNTTLDTYLGNNLADPAEIDIEGSAAAKRSLPVGEVTAQTGVTDIYWIGSHSRGAEGQVAPMRSNLFSLVVNTAGMDVRTGITPYKNLLQDLYTYGEAIAGTTNFWGSAQVEVAGSLLQYASTTHPIITTVRNSLKTSISSTPLVNGQPTVNEPQLAPKLGGINIEGLATTPTGDLLLGFRNPLIPVTVNNVNRPHALLLPFRLLPTGTNRAKFTTPVLLDLEGRGIRSIDYDIEHNRYFIVAGMPGDEKDSVLYTWNGQGGSAPVRITTPNAEYMARFTTPEAIFPVTGTDDVMVLSDDGSLRIGGLQPSVAAQDNDEQAAATQFFRSVRLNIPAPLNPGIFRSYYTASYANPYQTETSSVFGTAGSVLSGNMVVRTAYPRATAATVFSAAGTASYTADYTFTSGSTLTLPALGQQASTAVTFLNDPLLEPSETIRLSLNGTPIKESYLAAGSSSWYDGGAQINGVFLDGTEAPAGNMRNLVLNNSYWASYTAGWAPELQSGIAFGGNGTAPLFEFLPSELPLLSTHLHWSGKSVTAVGHTGLGRIAGNLIATVSATGAFDSTHGAYINERANNTALPNGSHAVGPYYSHFSCLTDTTVATQALIGGKLANPTAAVNTMARVWQVSDPGVGVDGVSTLTVQTLPGHEVISITPSAALIKSIGTNNHTFAVAFRNSGVYGTPIPLPFGTYTPENAFMSQTAAGLEIAGTGVITAPGATQGLRRPLRWVVPNGSTSIGAPTTLSVVTAANHTYVAGISSTGSHIVGADYSPSLWNPGSPNVTLSVDTNYRTILWTRGTSSITVDHAVEIGFVPTSVNTSGGIAGVVDSYISTTWPNGAGGLPDQQLIGGSAGGFMIK